MVTLPKVGSDRGSPMGRATISAPASTVLKFSLQYVPINAGGYDSGGAYWGRGSRLYWAAAVGADGAEVSEFYRGASRADVKAKVRKWYPGATFNGGGRE